MPKRSLETNNDGKWVGRSVMLYLPFTEVALASAHTALHGGCEPRRHIGAAVPGDAAAGLPGAAVVPADVQIKVGERLVGIPRDEQGNRGSNEQAFRHFEALADVVLASRPGLVIKTACAVCMKKQPALWRKHLEAKKVWGDTAGVLRAAAEAELVRI